jgi:hypothetical protein
MPMTDDPLNSLPPPESPESTPASDAEFHGDAFGEERARSALLRKMFLLLVATAAAFALTTWMLVRMRMPGGTGAQDFEPAGVVRAQLDALNRGQLREAYNLFSAHYREQVPFEAFHDLIASHWRIFRAQKIQVERREETRVRAVLDTHILAADGERYLARYTLIETEGRWWIDDLHWGYESPTHRQFAGRAERAVTS